MKFLQVIAMLAGIASAGVAVVTYLAKSGGGARHRDAPASSAPSGPAHTAPSAPTEGQRGAARQSGGDGPKK